MQEYIPQIRDWFNSNIMSTQILLYILIIIIVANFVKKIVNILALVLTVLIVSQIYFNVPLVSKIEGDIFVRFKDQSITVNKDNIQVRKTETPHGNDYIVLDTKNPKLKMEFRIKDNLISKIFDFILDKYDVKLIINNIQVNKKTSLNNISYSFRC